MLLCLRLQVLGRPVRLVKFAQLKRGGLDSLMTAPTRLPLYRILARPRHPHQQHGWNRLQVRPQVDSTCAQEVTYALNCALNPSPPPVAVI